MLSDPSRLFSNAPQGLDKFPKIKKENQEEYAKLVCRQLSSGKVKLASRVDAGAAVQVADTDELLQTVSRWLGDANERHRDGQLGRQVVEKNRGALQAVMTIIEQYL